MENKFSKLELSGHKSAVYCVKFASNGEHIMSGSQDKTIKLWNPYKGLLIKSYDSIHSHDVLDICISQDNTKFSSVGIDKQVFYTDSITGKIERRFYGHTDRINSIAFNKHESVLVSGSYDCSVRIWDLKSQSREPIQILQNAKDSISKILVLNDKIVSASVDGNMRVYDIRMATLQCDNFDQPINGLDVSPDEKYYVVSTLDGDIRLYEYEKGEVIQNYSKLHQCMNYSASLKYSIDNNGFYITSENGDIVYYDIINKSNNRIFKAHTKTASGLDVHPFKKNYFVSSGFDSKIFFWDTTNSLVI
jgi:mitogen-activated protein kinase organizer 1